ncbi:alpha-galactosidase [Hydrotalea sp.]|uniref:alpha-galactosidase n=1 Tax=Hydrotalea sp. TaxID=2881279 RepID=UPI003D133E53
MHNNPITAILASIFFALVGLTNASAQVASHVEQNGDKQIFILSNSKVSEQIVVQHQQIQSDVLSANANWLEQYQNSKPYSVYTDADFSVELMWTDWSAPGKDFNGDLQVTLSKKDFVFQQYEWTNLPNGKALQLYFQPIDKENTLRLRITYLLLENAFYAKRKIALIDTTLQKQWVEAFNARKGKVYFNNEKYDGYSMREESSTTAQYVALQQHNQTESFTILKKGDFGQPCAAQLQQGGVFFGVEYPAANSLLTRINENDLQLKCKELMGVIVKDKWIESSWVVQGLSPNKAVQDWFYNYVNEIKVMPDEPYALYNSWYDLRSPSYPKVAPAHVMNEKNILHIIDLFKKNMTEKYGIHLNAFVLDDGWDVYESNWMLNKTTFPNGLQPIVNALKPMGTTLGIWLGPTGGYSFRMKRINWMKAHGYETVGKTPNDAMLDIAGPNYSKLFEQRVTDFTKQGVGYFKWDGIQFSSSESGNGHAIGYHSRRAAVESVIDKCKAVRAINPKEYLNITSGTWLSPWWLQYANQIWMQGADYGYANTPVINDRDAAMTYKDIVLYDDFNRQDVWFPLSNMMTHGIIKGNLASVGGNDDPLAKFADDVVFYFSRGVTMYELYLSPDLLNDDEWKVLSLSLNWAKQHFSLMDKTFMVGGNPANGNAYGFAHFKNNEGIIAVRNPKIQSEQLTVKLSTQYGIADTAASLVLERVYPTHWVSPNLYAAGTTIVLPELQGFEVAVYRVYPLQKAVKPLLTNVIMQEANTNHEALNCAVLATTGKVQLLNPEMVKSVTINNELQNINQLIIHEPKANEAIKGEVQFSSNHLNVKLNTNENIQQTRVVVMMQPDSVYIGKPFPTIQILQNGQSVNFSKQQQDGHWGSYSVIMKGMNNTITFKILPNEKANQWKAKIEVWTISQQKQQPVQVKITTLQPMQQTPQLPSPYEKNALQKTALLATGTLYL